MINLFARTNADRLAKNLGVLLSLLMLWTTIDVIAQQGETGRSILSKEGREQVQYLSESTNIKIVDTLHYYWHFGNKIKSTQGGYDGHILDGEYIRFDKKDNLLEKGFFKKGLKNGQWKQWNEDGKLLLREDWKHGLLHGKQYLYVDGHLKEIITHRKGLKHGASLTYANGEMSNKTVFKKNIIKVPKVKKVKVKKIKKVPLVEKDVDKGSVEKQTKEKKIKEKSKKEKPEKERKTKTQKDPKK